jgi:hypothetical protein
MLFEVFYPDQLFHWIPFFKQCKELGKNYLFVFFKKFYFLNFSSFTQLLQQTRVIDQLQQSGRSYTLFIPTNTALQTIGVTQDFNRIRQVFQYFYFIF